MIIINTFSRIKPGTNNVKLLNSAVINKFTMLTYRQPLTGKDRLVADIYLLLGNKIMRIIIILDTTRPSLPMALSQ